MVCCVADKSEDLYREFDSESVTDYEFTDSDGGSVRLSELFGSQSDLIMIHNMGKSCTYCSMWADGFTGLLDHLQNRAAFVVSSPDPPAVQGEFKESRGWTFRMVSTAHSPFTREMGFHGDDGYWPGVSAFHRNDDGSIVRTGSDFFGPYDDYNAAWNLFSLLDGGAGEWEPQYSYT